MTNKDRVDELVNSLRIVEYTSKWSATDKDSLRDCIIALMRDSYDSGYDDGCASEHGETGSFEEFLDEIV